MNTQQKEKGWWHRGPVRMAMMMNLSKWARFWEESEAFFQKNPDQRPRIGIDV